jgi:hypothetical protein
MQWSTLGVIPHFKDEFVYGFDAPIHVLLESG